MSDSSIVILLFGVLQTTLVMLWFFLKDKFRTIDKMVERVNDHDKRISMLESPRLNDNGRRASYS